MPEANQPSWTNQPLKALVKQFLNGGTPRTENPSYWDGSIPWITGADAEERITVSSRKNITELGAKQSSTNIVPKGNILLVTRTGVGKVSIAGVDVAISQDLTGLIVDDEVADTSYLYRQLFFRGPELKRLSQGSIIQGIERGEVELLEIPTPCLEEQRQIAAILDTIDEAIATTAAQIKKLKLIKAGAIRELLTRGIDKNGEFRDPITQPEKFKISPLGLLPKSWSALPVESLLAPVNPAMRSGPFGSALLKSELVEKGVPILGIDNVHAENFIRDFSRFITQKKASELSRYKVRPNDVMITIMGTVGRCCVVPPDIGEAISSKHVWTLTIDQNKYSPLKKGLMSDLLTGRIRVEVDSSEES